jgi:hypothetical protein
VSLACLRARRPAGMTQLRGRGPGDAHGHDHGDGHRHGLEPAQARTKFSISKIQYSLRQVPPDIVVQDTPALSHFRSISRAPNLLTYLHIGIF